MCHIPSVLEISQSNLEVMTFFPDLRFVKRLSQSENRLSVGEIPK